MTMILVDPISGRRLPTVMPLAQVDPVTTVHTAIDADTAAREAAELAEQMRTIGALGAFSAMQALARGRKVRADRLWTMTTQALHAQASAGRAAAFTVR